VLVGDWQRHPKLGDDPHFVEELGDARRAVERCREIVSDILDTSGLTRGEAMGSVRAANLLEGLVQDWAALHVDIPLVASFAEVGTARVPAEPALRQAIWSLLENGGEVSASGIEMTARVEKEQLVVEVFDRGRGFLPHELARVGQISCSRKGSGHGLGLFLAANVARRLGGALTAANRRGGGAAVRLSLPLVGLGEVPA
jgi:two-component system sensor histidine kinase RegB